MDDARQALGLVAGLADARHGRAENLAQGVDQSGDGGVRTHGPALAAGGAVFRNPARVGIADAAHVAKQCGRGRHHTHGHEGIGQVVVAHAARIQTAGIGPEALDIAQRRLAGRQCPHRDRQARNGRLSTRFFRQAVVGDLTQLIVTTPDHAQIVLDHPGAAGTELLLQSLAHGVDQALLVQAMIGQQTGGGKECPLEGDALHAQLQIRIGRFLARDAKGVQTTQANAALDDLAPVALRQALEGLFRGLGVGLHDQQAPLAQSRQRIAVAEHIRVRRQHHIHMLILAIDPDLFRRHGQVEGGRLALFLRAVLGIGLDVPAEQIKQRGGQMLASGDRAPTADRVHAHGQAICRHQVGILAALDHQLDQVRIVARQALLADLVLGVQGRFPQEIDTEVILAPPGPARQHVFDRADQIARRDIAAPQAKAGRVQVGCQGQIGIGWQSGMHRSFAGAAVFQAFADRRADLAGQRRIDRQRLIDPFQHGDRLAALQHPADQIGRKRPEHDQIDHPDLEAAALAQVVGHRLGGGDDTALPQQQIVGVVRAISGDPCVVTAGQCGVFLESLLGQRRNRVEEERSLGGHTLHVGILVLHRAGHHRVVHIPQFGHAAASLAEQQALGRGRAFDQVFRTTQVLGHQFPFGHHQRLDQMRGQKSVLGHDAGIERQFGQTVGNQIQIGRGLGVAGKHLEKAGVIHAVVVVMAGMHIQAGLGHGTAAHIEHIGQAFAHGRIE